MSAYSNHSICSSCWQKRNPGRTPFAVSDDFTRPEKCCFCQADTIDRVYVNEKNEKLACKGEHGKNTTVIGATVAKAAPSDGDIK